MNRASVFSALGVVLVALLLTSPAVAAQPIRGYAMYSVSASTPVGNHSMVVNETIGPSSKAGYSVLILRLLGDMQNLTYSKLVNASDNLFPYLPNLGTQSFSYSNGTLYNVQVNITASSSTTVTFDGNQYSMSVFAISVSASAGGKSVEANGTVETFPSTLVYSASAGNSTYKIQVLLQATDLPLTGPAPQMDPAMYAGAGIGIGAVAAFGALMIRHREKKVEKQGEKPLHWVD